MLNYSDALRIVCDESSKIETSVEKVHILQSVNRILAEDVYSDINLPPFNNSAMDGYAFCYSDVRKWKLIGEISAGNYKDYILSPDETVLITTGSKLPDSADSVVPLEDVEISDSFICLKDNVKIKRGMNVRLCGSDLKKDQVVVHKYTKINPQVVAALASCGMEQVNVLQKLKLAILTTGDELVPVSQKPTGDKIRVSNSYALSAAVTELHQSADLLGVVNDDKSRIKELISDALHKECDFLITTGGVSVGKYDFLIEVFSELKIEVRFWKVNIKPGKPIVFGVYQKNERKILVFGLPGNPVSSLVNFQIFIRPAIAKILHQQDSAKISALLLNGLTKNDTKRHFLRGELVNENGEWRATPFSSRSSGDFAEMSKSNCLIEIPEHIMNAKQGDVVECLLI